MEHSLYDPTLPTHLLAFPLFSIGFDIQLSLICCVLFSYWTFFNSNFLCHGNSKKQKKKTTSNACINPTTNNEAEYETEVQVEHDSSCDRLCGQDIELVMERLGIQPSLDQELQKKWDYKEMCEIYDEEPSLEEVKEAFDVFDENKDGFIDAKELQRVLLALGLKQGFELNECNKMIKVFDQNNDGKIDFNEFVKFMLNTL